MNALVSSFHRVIFCCLFVAALTSSARAKCEGKETFVRLALIAGAEATPQQQLAKEIQTEFQRSLNGKWCIDFVVPAEGEASSVGLEKLRGKQADIALVTLDDLSIASPLHRVFELPFVFRDMLAVRTFLADPGSDALIRWQGEGLRSLALVPFGMEQLAGKKAFLKPSDIAGARFGLSINQATRPMVSALRATGRMIASADTKKALSEGSMDTQMARWEEFVQSKTAENHTVFTQSNHALEGVQVIAASSWLGTLKPADITLLTRAINSAVALFNTRQAERERAAQTQLMRSGKPIFLITEDALQEWRDSLQTLFASFAALPGGQAILDAVDRGHDLPN